MRHWTGNCAYILRKLCLYCPCSLFIRQQGKALCDAAGAGRMDEVSAICAQGLDPNLYTNQVSTTVPLQCLLYLMHGRHSFGNGRL